MEWLMQAARSAIEHYGYAGIFVLTALEQFIFPIPADAFAVIGVSIGLSFRNIMLLMLLAALIGSYAGYFLGKTLGHPLMTWLFGKTKLDKGEAFIKKYGVWGVILAGLTPIPFKIVTWTAGIFEMPLGRFTLGVILGRMSRYLLTGFAATLIYKTKFYASTEMSALLLGTLQGLTEFLPISSSGHLTLAEHFLRLPANIQASDLELFDIFLHGGSLLAIVLYFWRDWLHVFRELWKMATEKKINPDALATKLAVGTLPALAAGLLFGHFINNQLRGIHFVASMLLVIAFFYLFAEWRAGRNTHEHISLKKSLLVGFAQALALIPGISRSGSTISVGMLMGLKREAAAKFSFMLGGVAILAANLYALLSVKNGGVIPPASFILIGTVASFLISLIAIRWLLRFLQKHTLRPFSFYLLLIGTLILTVF